MAAPLNTCTTIEQRGVVRFLWAKNMEAKDIHKEMLPIWATVAVVTICTTGFNVPPTQCIYVYCMDFTRN
jgi:hypothetical protein